MLQLDGLIGTVTDGTATGPAARWRARSAGPPRPLLGALEGACGEGRLAIERLSGTGDA